MKVIGVGMHQLANKIVMTLKSHINKKKVNEENRYNTIKLFGINFIVVS
jgi:hypothetical protein